MQQLQSREEDDDQDMAPEQEVPPPQTERRGIGGWFLREILETRIDFFVPYYVAVGIFNFTMGNTFSWIMGGFFMGVALMMLLDLPRQRKERQRFLDISRDIERDAILFDQFMQLDGLDAYKMLHQIEKARFN